MITTAIALPLGRIVITPDARDALSDGDIFGALSRHQSGDWGAVSKADWVANNLSVKRGLRVLSAYISASEERFWILTEADRSYTTILLPDEY